MIQFSEQFIDSAYLFVSLYRDELRLAGMALIAGGLLVGLISSVTIVIQGVFRR